MRIVSMLSSATEIVHALGLGDRLVGISHECDHPPEALRLPRASRPRFEPSGMTSGEIDAAVRRAMEEHGSVYEVDVGMLRKLSPDLILTQAVCEVCAVPTGSIMEAVERLSAAPRVLSLDAHTMEQIIGSVREVADATGEPNRGARLAEEMEARLAVVRERVADRRRPRVLMLEWLDPFFTPGHWVPQMVEIAGGDLLLGEAGQRSEQVEPGRLQGLDPDILLVEPCGYDLEQARADADAHRAWLERLAPRAVAARQAWLLHSSYYSRSGPRVIDGVEAISAILHPETHPDPPSAAIAVRW